MTREEFDEMVLSRYGVVCIGDTTWHIAQWIAALEREACAQLCEEGKALRLAEIIRARGKA